MLIVQCFILHNFCIICDLYRWVWSFAYRKFIFLKRISFVKQK